MLQVLLCEKHRLVQLVQIQSPGLMVHERTLALGQPL